MFAVGGGVGAFALAACSSGGGEPVNPPADTTEPAPTSDAATSADATTDAGGGAGAAIANTADVPVGGAISAQTAAGEGVLITQPTEGDIHVFSDVCTHEGCTVAPADGELDCPCHGSRFDLTSGDVLGGPATSPLPTVNFSVAADGSITA